MIVRKYLKISGSVQGVGFRYRAKYAANMLGVSGWVRNDYDGTVSMEIQGTEEQIEKVLMLINQGSFIDIQDIKEKKLSPLTDENGFRIRGY